ncbi:hypothetical protein QJS66_01400 [Kocuria rhizophila]|nr:hypothetical protein QJS66_01400 [Kocuria rhizophila]
MRDGDAGRHLFVAASTRPVPGTTRAVMAASSGLLFSDPSVQRGARGAGPAQRQVPRDQPVGGVPEVRRVPVAGKTACVKRRRPRGPCTRKDGEDDAAREAPRREPSPGDGRQELARCRRPAPDGRRRPRAMRCTALPWRQKPAVEDAPAPSGPRPTAATARDGSAPTPQERTTPSTATTRLPAEHRSPEVTR